MSTQARDGAAPAAGGAASASELPPRLAFAVLGSEVDQASATPAIALSLEVRAPVAAAIRSVTLGVQVRIAPRRRAYDGPTKERLGEVFGTSEQWARSLHSLLWTRTVVVVPPFVDSARVVIALPCSYDLEVASTQVLHGLRDGAVPLELHFSGTLFYALADGALRTALLPWDDGIVFDLPSRVWWDAIDRFFPGSAWLRVDRDTLDRLHAFRRRGSLLTWDAAIAALLAERDGGGDA